MKPSDPGNEAHQLTAVENLFDYFNEQVQAARGDQGLAIADDTALYLAQLLSDRARSDRPTPAFETLAELHALAASAPPGKKASMYRELGDRALYLLGCFREHLDRARRPLSPSYYEDMGAAAYHQCDRVLKIWFSDAFGPVFLELARKFGGCVQLLSSVKHADAQRFPGLIAPSGLILPGRVGET